MKHFSEVSEDDINDYYKIISKNIKNFRVNKKLTQEEVSLAMGFTTATFYTNAESLKRGKHFNLEHLIKLSKILNVDISEFFRNVE